MNIYCTIMAGGQGNRLWPLSQMNLPKQFLDLMGIGMSMLQLTYNRFRSVCPPDHFIVVTNKSYVDIVKKQLPDLPESNIICEPFRRNTAACIAYANAYIKQKDKNAIVIVTPSDHLIINEQMFVDSVMAGAEFAASGDYLVTIGVRAHKPETAFGYIQTGAPVGAQFPLVNKVKTFTEKPNADMAQIFYECGDFCWNTGVFVWSVMAIDQALTKYMPNIQSQFDAIDSLPTTYWTEEAISRVYEECENVSIDYGVLEKARNVYMVQAEAQWSDLGSWEALYENCDKDESLNANLSGIAIMHDSDKCLVSVPKNKYCVVDGLSNYMIVERGNVLLICPRENSKTSWNYASEISAIKNSSNIKNH